MEWPIDALSEGNCESFEYILLLRATGSVLPYSGNTNNTFSSSPNQNHLMYFSKIKIYLLCRILYQIGYVLLYLIAFQFPA